MMKHAYLILAHTDFAMLQILVSRLDDKRNDIYIHFDSKVGQLPAISTTEAQLHVLSDRVDVRWGDISVVEAEYALFAEACKNGPYAYYHLLSGADLPLKTQDEIHHFFEEHQGKEFIGYTFTSITPEVTRKMMRWHIFPKNFRDASIPQRILRAAFIRLQELAGWKRNESINFAKGSQWVSVTDRMARLFLEGRDWAMKTFPHTFCSDEIVMQTLCWNSELKDNIWCTDDDGKGCMRAISWKNGVMLSWSKDDYERLCKGEMLFARKFTSREMARLAQK